MSNNIPALDTFKQLIKQLDAKFGLIEKQLEQVETKLDNFRAFNERSQLELKNELSQIKTELHKKLDLKADIKAINKKDDVQDITTAFSTGQDDLKTKKQISKKLETPYGGLKQIPTLEAFKEEGLSKDELYSSSKKKKIKKEALKEYLEKVERAIMKTWPVAERHLKRKESTEFIDKSLTVLHGIIEFTFVAFRNEFPDPSLSYIEKARNLSGLGVFKDVSLLEKIENVYSQLENKEEVLLANPLLLGWNERITKIYDDFLERKREAYSRLISV